VLQALAGPDPRDPAAADVPVPDYRAGLAAPIAGLRIGVPYAWFTEETKVDAGTLAAFEAALAVLREQGAEIRPVTLPPLVEYEDTKKILALCDLFAAYGDGLRRHPDLY